ncbi:MAG: OmpA family protein [Gallionella sp.]|nr:OmpA family protein [Gallionella sp.]
MKTSRRVLLNTLAMASLALSGMALADETTKEGYLTDSRGDLVKSGTGLCWHTGFWTPAMAIAECDPVPAVAPVPRLARAMPPVAAPVPARTSFAPRTLQIETLFAFDSSELSSVGKKKMSDEVVVAMKESPQDEVVLVTGYTDRIGQEQYNQALSQRRADAARTFLIGQGINANRIETAARGESEPIVSCDNVKGRANHNNHALINCLQPNRRIVMEVKGQNPAKE